MNMAVVSYSPAILQLTETVRYWSVLSPAKVVHELSKSDRNQELL